MCFYRPTYMARNWGDEIPEPTPFDLLWLAWWLHNNGND